ncbi:MAG: rhodanese-like domain-containing protein [Pseudomonadota bacterium]
MIAGLAAGGLCAFFLVSTRPRAAAGTVLNPQEVHEALDEKRLILVDIRRPDEWTKTGVAQGAIPIDMRRGDFVDAVQEARGPDPDIPVALICARGVRSRRMTRALVEAGIGPIIDIPEGMLGSSDGPGWLGRGLPIVEYKA